MKKSVIAALALSLMLMAGAAGASVIGIFGDMGATQCAFDVPGQYTTMSIYFVALLDDIPAMSACEFAATGTVFPAGAFNPNGGTPTWETDLVIGNLVDGIALAFSTPLAAPLAYLGRLDYFVLTGDFSTQVGADWVMSVVESDAGVLVVVDADTAIEYPAEGWSCIVNCTVGGPYGNCQCEDSVATEDAAWGQIKALY